MKRELQKQIEKYDDRETAEKVRENKAGSKLKKSDDHP